MTGADMIRLSGNIKRRKEHHKKDCQSSQYSQHSVVPSCLMHTVLHPQIVQSDPGSDLFLYKSDIIRTNLQIVKNVFVLLTAMYVPAATFA